LTKVLLSVTFFAPCGFCRLRGFEFVGEKFMADDTPFSKEDSKALHDALPEPKQCVHEP